MTYSEVVATHALSLERRLATAQEGRLSWRKKAYEARKQATLWKTRYGVLRVEIAQLRRDNEDLKTQLQIVGKS